MTDLITRCAWCGLVRRGNFWVTEFVPLDADNVTHGMCPSCRVEMEREIGKIDDYLSESTPPPRPI